MFGKLITKSTLAALLIAGASGAWAATCATGTEDDFTYRGTTAAACEAGSGNPGDPESFFGSSWNELVKFDLSQSAAVGTTFWGDVMNFGAGTIKFGLKFLGLGADGFYSYELLAEDDPESVLPATMDLVGVVKQASGYQAYSFDDAYVGDSGNLGTFKSLFGPNTNNAFSHFSIYGGDYKECTDGDCGGGGDEIPEPATLALVGLGLLGAAASRRRRRA